jgi:hypothetical protein
VAHIDQNKSITNNVQSYSMCVKFFIMKRESGERVSVEKLVVSEGRDRGRFTQVGQRPRYTYYNIINLI